MDCLPARDFLRRVFRIAAADRVGWKEERPGGGRAQATMGRALRWGAVAVEKVEAEPRLAELSTQWNLVFETQDRHAGAGQPGDVPADVPLRRARSTATCSRR